MNYFKVWWNGIQVAEKFPNKKEAEKYIRKMRAYNSEIIEFNEECQVMNSWKTE
jgi:hypothetical protein